MDEGAYPDGQEEKGQGGQAMPDESDIGQIIRDEMAAGKSQKQAVVIAVRRVRALRKKKDFSSGSSGPLPDGPSNEAA